MLVTESGITMLLSDVQPWNAYPPMLITESGISMLLMDVQKWNA